MNAKAFAPLFVAAALGAAALATPAQAGPKLFAYSGNSITFNGTTETDSGNVDPFSVELFSAGNECLRVAVLAQGTDLSATLVSPDGRIWSDDDGGGSLRPLVKAITVKRGWYILRLSNWAGVPVHADFTVQVSRLPSNSFLCSGPTLFNHLELSAPAAKPPTAGVMTIQPGGTK